MKLFEMGKNVSIKILIWYKTGEMIKNWVEQGFIFHAFMFIIISTHYTHSVHPPPPFGWGWVEHPTKFSKTTGLTRSQFLEGVSLFQGELQFSYKKN